MRTTSGKTTLAVAAGLLAAGLLIAAAPAQAQGTLKASLLGSGPLIIPNDATVNGLTVGGLSGITYAGGSTYYSIVDQGPTNDVAARFYTLNLAVDATGPHAVAGQPVALGVSTLTGVGGAAYNGSNFDGEGIALTGAGTVLISSETEPSVREFSLNGAQQQQFATPAAFAAGTGTTGIQFNRGFESLTLSPGGNSFWTANERSLKQDGTLDPLDSAPNDVRLLRYDRTGGAFAPGGQFVYNVGAASVPSGATFATKGLCDLIAMPDGTMLALERSFYTLGATDPHGTYGVQLYQISFAGATDVSGLSALQGQSYTRVSKTLLYDFAAAGLAPGSLDNVEGMTFGPTLENGDRSLVLIADNNFSPFEQTQIFALRLAAVPEPGPVTLFVVGGLLLAVRARRRAGRQTGR